MKHKNFETLVINVVTANLLFVWLLLMLSILFSDNVPLWIQLLIGFIGCPIWLYVLFNTFIKSKTMENRKQFKPYDRVLVRDDEDNWQIDLYSHWSKEKEQHVTLAFGDGIVLTDRDVLPYEGNENLLGTTGEPDEEIELMEGEWVMVCDKIEDQPDEWKLRYFMWANEDKICIQRVRYAYPDPYPYSYAIRFKDFDPSNMVETCRHIMCVKNGKVVRYHHK